MERLKAVLGERVLHQAGVAMNTILRPLAPLHTRASCGPGSWNASNCVAWFQFRLRCDILAQHGSGGDILVRLLVWCIFLALAPGFIAGIGLSMWFSQYMEHRSLARRRKVVPQKTAYLLSAP